LCAERLPVAHPGTRPRAYPQRARSGREALAGRHLLRQRPHKRHLGPLSPSPAQQRRASPRTAGWSGVVTATSVRRGSVILTIVASSRFRRPAILDARPLDVDLGFPVTVSSRGRCSRRRAGREWASAAAVRPAPVECCEFVMEQTPGGDTASPRLTIAIRETISVTVLVWSEGSDASDWRQTRLCGPGLPTAHSAKPMRTWSEVCSS
jgi:hypothetical protein